MNAKFILFFSIAVNFCNTNAYGQFFYPFENLEVQDTIRDVEKIDKFRAEGIYLSGEYFIKAGETGNSGAFLFKKQANYWLVVNLPGDDIGNEISNIKFNGRYLYYQSCFSHASRGIIGDYSYFNIIDPQKLAVISLQSYSYLEQWNTDDENAVPEKTSCSVKIIMDTAGVEMYASDNKGECNTGIFKFTDTGLIKVKRYDEKNYRMVPVRWVRNIATGMTLEEFGAAFSYAELRPSPNIYGNCAEDEREGYSVLFNDKPILFLVMEADDKHIQNIITISPEYFLGNLHTGMTVQEVMQIYPDATMRKDLLSEQEYMFIEELGIDLVFNTTEDNRVGFYKYNRKLSEEVFKKLKRKDAKVDWIILR